MVFRAQANYYSQASSKSPYHVYGHACESNAVRMGKIWTQ